MRCDNCGDYQEPESERACGHTVCDSCYDDGCPVCKERADLDAAFLEPTLTCCDTGLPCLRCGQSTCTCGGHNHDMRRAFEEVDYDHD